ncbi:MAG: hypothetical protein KKB74_05105 [Bacteroidetes bacterium]|nr:hypothetical protein [Bacteroidota bacterium]
MKLIKTHKDLDVYQQSSETGLAVFFASKGFLKEETHLTLLKNTTGYREK